MNDSANYIPPVADPEETNLKEFGLLNFLKTEKGKSYLKYRFFREPYWIGYMSILTTTLVALITIGLSYTPLAFLAMPLVAFFFYSQLHGIYKFVKNYIDEQEAMLAENPEHIYEARPQNSFISSIFTKDQERSRSTNFYFDALVYGYHFLYFSTALLAMYAAYVNQSYIIAITFAILWGFLTSLVAESWSHEFIHRRAIHQQMLGASLWATFFYGTFLPEHTMGHHVHVSTPEDPSSAPKGMTLYQFLPNAILKNAVNGFKLEAKRLRDRDLSFWSPRNRLLWLTAFSFAWMGLSYVVGGVYGFTFWAVATVGSIITIELANYVMHYGLERKKLDNGRYERVSPLHSWNVEGPLHMIVINLTRHSDHHAFPRRPYQILRYFPEAPQLPISYERLIFMAWFPKYFFKVMDPRVDEHMNKLQEWKDNNIDDYKRVMDFEATINA
jgi:alkane 1-monooxygenase